NKSGNTIVKAEVPMSEMLTYGVDLTAMTQGRGSFTMEMHHYDVVPGQLQEKIIEKVKAQRGEVEEEGSEGQSYNDFAMLDRLNGRIVRDPEICNGEPV